LPVFCSMYDDYYEKIVIDVVVVSVCSMKIDCSDVVMGINEYTIEK